MPNNDLLMIMSKTLDFCDFHFLQEEKRTKDGGKDYKMSFNCS